MSREQWEAELDRLEAEDRRLADPAQWIGYLRERDPVRYKLLVERLGEPT